eukprot:2983774-Pyramimonas_sp.AAC.1
MSTASTCPRKWFLALWSSKGCQECHHTSTMQSPSFALTLASTPTFHSTRPSGTTSYLTNWLLHKTAPSAFMLLVS